jgi:formylglycine-generating enzyme required for sulfatase activity
VPIGAGAQAEVWPAEREDGLAVAIKLARPARAAVDALRSEGRFLEALTRGGAACAVPCIDHVEWQGRPGLVLPRLARDVDAHVRAGMDADPERALEVVLGVAGQLARALAALHAAELVRPGEVGWLVHRDVKPENVLVDASGAVRLADLGGSLLADGTAARELGVFGSLSWAPLDQMLPAAPEPNPTWDTYAACLMLFVWVTGTRPALQTDPGARLTPRGHAIWTALRAMGTAPTAADRQAAVDSLFRAREGTRVDDVVARDARVALLPSDRALVLQGVSELADRDVYGDDGLEDAGAALLALFERGLSPRWAPSPPNRFWYAGDLAEAIELVAIRLALARRARTEPRAWAADHGPSLALVRNLGGGVPSLAYDDPGPPGDPGRAAVHSFAQAAARARAFPDESTGPRPSRFGSLPALGAPGDGVVAPRPSRFGSLPALGPPAEAPRGAGVSRREAGVGLVEGAAVSLDRVAIPTPRRPPVRPRWFHVLLPLVLLGAILAARQGQAPTVGAGWPDTDTVPVPAGSLTLGASADDHAGRPARTVALHGFRLARTEVSNRAYRACVDDGSCSPAAWATPGTPWELGVGARGEAFRLLTGDRQPVVGVTWSQATRWCAWAGGRLPTEEEWEYAAVGNSDGSATPRRWPWGADRPDCTRANFADCGLGLTVAVDSLEPGASAWGAVQLVGNAWEWTASPYRVGERSVLGALAHEERVLRGGAFDSGVRSLRPTFRGHADPDAVSEVQSFRCVFPE